MKLKMIAETITSSIPSLQDLISVIQLSQIGKKNSVIYPSNGGYIIIRPIKGKNPNVDKNKYDQMVKLAIQNDDYSIIVNSLKDMGFDISGKVNQTRIGNSSNPQLERQIEQIKTKIPKSNKEIGGISGMTSGGLHATKQHITQTPDYVEGKPDSIELEVEYDPDQEDQEDQEDFVFHTHPEPTGGYEPKEALRHIDKTSIYRTHPKMTNNNYFPEKMK